jgi:hypothetical protein
VRVSILLLQVAVELKHTPASSRGVFARKRLSLGDVMAAVPLSLGYVIQPGVRQLVSSVGAGHAPGLGGRWPSLMCLCVCLLSLLTPTL